MWFLIGLILLPCLSAYLIHKRLYGPKKGIAAKVKNHDYQYKLEESQYFSDYLYLGIKSNFQLDFYLKKELWYDRIAKRLGVAKEIQTGNQKFDEHIYLMSDSEQLYQYFKNKEALLDVLYDAFIELNVHSYRLREIRQHSGALWVKVKIPKDFKDTDSQLIALILVPRLAELLERLSQFKELALAEDGDKFEIKAMAFLGLGSGLTLNSLIHYLQYSGNKIPLILDKNLLIQTSFHYGLITTILSMCLAFWLLGRGARTHLFLFKFFVIGGIGFISTFYIGIYKFNIEYDVSENTHLQAQVIRKNIPSRNLFSDDHDIKIGSWNDKNEQINIKVSKQLFDGLKRWDSINITLRKGYFGYEWIESTTKLD